MGPCLAPIGSIFALAGGTGFPGASGDVDSGSVRTVSAPGVPSVRSEQALQQTGPGRRGVLRVPRGQAADIGRGANGGGGGGEGVPRGAGAVLSREKRERRTVRGRTSRDPRREEIEPFFFILLKISIFSKSRC